MYRTRSAVLELPPLRDRKEDVAVLAEHYLAQIREREGASFQLSARLVEQLSLYHWPGNVRELDRVLREATVQATVRGDAVLRPSHLRESIKAGAEPSETDELTRLRRALEQAAGNVSHAAAELGIRRAEVYRLLKEHNLKAADFRE
jgi:transcriptional regulator of acetoin/glycerol metabolism